MKLLHYIDHNYICRSSWFIWWSIWHQCFFTKHPHCLRAKILYIIICFKGHVLERCLYDIWIWERKRHNSFFTINRQNWWYIKVHRRPTRSMGPRKHFVCNPFSIKDKGGISGKSYVLLLLKLISTPLPWKAKRDRLRGYFSSFESETLKLIAFLPRSTNQKILAIIIFLGV